jgi:hypothetical protein
MQQTPGVRFFLFLFYSIFPTQKPRARTFGSSPPWQCVGMGPTLACEWTKAAWG